MNISSATGRMPAIAAPTGEPMIADSEIGVSMTRSVPNRSTRPAETREMPVLMSTPIMYTVRSTSIAGHHGVTVVGRARPGRSEDKVTHVARCREIGAAGARQRRVHLDLDLEEI